jgi:hypothetical protein
MEQKEKIKVQKVYWIEGIKDAGKSEWILRKKDELISEAEGWEQVYPDINGMYDRNTVKFILERDDQRIILNSGSDTHAIINAFKDFLEMQEEITEVYTAIRPCETNQRLHMWMKKALNDTLSIESEESIIIKKDGV